jgi:TPR repeat protein
MQDLAELTKKDDFDPNAPFGDTELLKDISERVRECGIPREELRVEMPDELKAIAEARMAEYAEKSKQRLEEQIAEHRAKTEAACNAGEGEACYRLAELAHDPEEGEADPQQVLALLDKSCELSHAEGCRILGESMREQDDTESLPLALAYFEKGCALDDLESCQALSEAYTVGNKPGSFSMHKGLGVKKNKKKARLYKEKAERIAIENAKALGVLGVIGEDADLEPVSGEIAKPQAP